MLKYQWIRTINTGFGHLCTEQSVNHHLREFNVPQKNANELGPAWYIVGNHHIRKQMKIAFSYSDPGGTLENKSNDLKPLFSRKKSLTFHEVKENALCIGGQILPTRINNNRWKLIYMSRTIPSSQYETNLWSTHVNIVRLAEPIRRCVRWRTQVFKIEGFVCKRFLPSPSPPPPPTCISWLLFYFSCDQNRESRSSVFLCSETKRKRLLRRLLTCHIERWWSLSVTPVCFMYILISCGFCFWQNFIAEAVIIFFDLSSMKCQAF